MLAYFGDPAQRRVYQDAQDCALRFREYCLQNNLLDFSLQLEVFSNILWPLDIVRDYLHTHLSPFDLRQCGRGQPACPRYHPYLAAGV